MFEGFSHLLGMPLAPYHSLYPHQDTFSIGVTLSLSKQVARCIHAAMQREVRYLEGDHPLTAEIMTASFLSGVLHRLGWKSFVTVRGRLDWIEPVGGKVLTPHDFWLFSHIAREVLSPTKLTFLLGGGGGEPEHTLLTMRFSGKNGGISYEAQSETVPLSHAVRKAS